MQGKIHSVETFGTVDGPGVRYVIFLQGCPLRCVYCHNPDSWDINAGKWETVDALIEDIKKYTRYIEGITVSGGEPMLQLDFLIELFNKVKKLNLTTCLDTSGFVFNDSDESLVNKINKLLKVTDLVLLDIKHIDNTKHQKLTGGGNENVLKFAQYLNKQKINTWLRYVLVPTINDDTATLLKWKEFKDTLSVVSKVEVLPYHTMAIEKYTRLGLLYPLEGINEPTASQVEEAKKMLQ